VYLSKIDIADGFYRIWVRASDVPKLGVLFPSADGEEYLVGFPLPPPMGWTESPKIFTAATETITDITNKELSAGNPFGPHPLEVQSEASPPVSPVTAAVPAAPSASGNTPMQPPLPRGTRPKGAKHYRTPLSHWDVYVDDFLGLVQGGAQPDDASSVPCFTPLTQSSGPSTPPIPLTARSLPPPRKWRREIQHGPLSR
jgi:hypothetical protein